MKHFTFKAPQEWIRRTAFISLVSALMLLPLGNIAHRYTIARADNGLSCSRTYTLDADFDEGTLLNLNHDPNHDQLQLNRVTQPFPFVNIPCPPVEPRSALMSIPERYSENI